MSAILVINRSPSGQVYSVRCNMKIKARLKDAKCPLDKWDD